MHPILNNGVSSPNNLSGKWNLPPAKDANSNRICHLGKNRPSETATIPRYISNYISNRFYDEFKCYAMATITHAKLVLRRINEIQNVRKSAVKADVCNTNFDNDN